MSNLGFLCYLRHDYITMEGRGRHSGLFQSNSENDVKPAA